MSSERSEYKQHLEEFDREADEREANQKYAVRQLSRVPGHCPIGGCKEIIFPSNMMMHILHKHINTMGIASAEVFDHKPFVLRFDPVGIQPGVNYCLATLLYGGEADKPYTQPGLSYLSNPNSALINDHHRYDNYLPVMVMVCRSTWYAQLKDKLLERQMVCINARKAGIYVIWLVAPKTTRKVYFTLTAYDRYYLNSRSVIRVIRDYASSQNPSDFLPIEDNYLLLRDIEVKELMTMNKKSRSPDDKLHKQGIPMEIILYENPNDPPKAHCSHQEIIDALDALERVQEEYGTKMPRTRGPLRRIPLSKSSISRRPRSNPSLSTTPSAISSVFYYNNPSKFRV